MAQKIQVLCVAFLLLVAGCASTGGDGAGSPTDGGVDQTDATVSPSPGAGTGAQNAPGTSRPTATAAPTLADDHPYVGNGSLAVARLMRDHVDALRRTVSFTLTNNGTIRHAANRTLRARITDVRRFDLEGQRLAIRRSSVDADGDRMGVSGRFVNETTTCTVLSSDGDCDDDGFDRRRALGHTVETTSLETLAAPEFRAKGTVRKDGRLCYRYTAGEFRPSLSEDLRSELGPNPSLVNATLLVAPDGRIVSYRIAYERDAEGGRALMDRTYRTGAVNATTVQRPSWIPE